MEMAEGEDCELAEGFHRVGVSCLHRWGKDEHKVLDRHY